MTPVAVVIDASALLDYVLGERDAHAVDEVIRKPLVGLHAPDILDLEMLSAARRLELIGALSRTRAEEAVRDAMSIFIELHPLRPHADRVWSLRRNITVPDAYYVSLAEQLEASLLTTDGKLARAVKALRGVRVDVLDLSSG